MFRQEAFLPGNKKNYCYRYCPCPCGTVGTLHTVPSKSQLHGHLSSLSYSRDRLLQRPQHIHVQPQPVTPPLTLLTGCEGQNDSSQCKPTGRVPPFPLVALIPSLQYCTAF